MITRWLPLSKKRGGSDTANYIGDMDHAKPGEDFGPKIVAAGAMNAMNLDSLETMSFKETAEEINKISASYHGKAGPVVHILISWREGEHPSRLQVENAVKIAVRHLGLDGQMAVWGQHGNKPNDHVHVFASRLFYDAQGQLRVKEDCSTIRTGHNNNNQMSLQVASSEICATQGWEPEENARFGPDLKPTFRKKDEPTDEIQLRPRLLSWEAHHPGQKHPIRLMGEKTRDLLRTANSWPQARAALAAAGIGFDIRHSGEGAVLVGLSAEWQTEKGKATHLVLSSLPGNCSLKSLYSRWGDPRETAAFHSAAADRRAKARQEFVRQRYSKRPQPVRPQVELGSGLQTRPMPESEKTHVHEDENRIEALPAKVVVLPRL